jgi:hypothetical protein
MKKMTIWCARHENWSDRQRISSWKSWNHDEIVCMMWKVSDSMSQTVVAMVSKVIWFDWKRPSRHEPGSDVSRHFLPRAFFYNFSLIGICTCVMTSKPVGSIVTVPVWVTGAWSRESYRQIVSRWFQNHHGQEIQLDVMIRTLTLGLRNNLLWSSKRYSNQLDMKYSASSSSWIELLTSGTEPCLGEIAWSTKISIFVFTGIMCGFFELWRCFWISNFTILNNYVYFKCKLNLILLW